MNSLPTLDLYKMIIESINEGVCVLDVNKNIYLINQKLTEIIGYTENEILGRSVFDFMDTSKVEEVNQGIQRRKEGLAEVNEYLLKSKNGEQKWVTLFSQPLFHQEVFLGVLTTITDITEQKRNSQMLEENFRHYVSLFEDSPIPIWDEDFSAIKEEIDSLKNSGVKDITKYFEENLDQLNAITRKLIVNNINEAVVKINEAKSKEEVLSNFKNLVTAETSKYILIQLEAIANGSTTCEFDAELKTLKGNIRYVHLKWSVVKGYEHNYGRVYLTTTDLTERIKEENLVLQQSNREKAMLLREVHHRVKNNLQIISSLLRLQSYTIEDEEVQEIFNVSLNRINSMAKVHELLYKSSEFSEINYREYLETLINSLISTMSNKNQQIVIDLDVEDIKININTAIPLGLIINEILTNSFKHGFRDSLSGFIYVHIKQSSQNRFILKIGDDGSGFEPQADTNKSESLGLSLIESLTEQLSGKLVKVNHRKGTHYELEFSMVV